MNCIFCKIVNKEIPSSIVYEDENVLAFLDLTQLTKGHTLVIPKKHFDNMLETDDFEYLEVMKVVKKLAKAVEKAYNAKGCNIITNAGEMSGQAINHFHFHILPRYTKDEFGYKENDNTGKFDLNEIKNKIIANL